MRNLFVCFILFSCLSVYGQDESRIFFGVNAGTKLGNKTYALRYSGGYNDELYYAITSPNVYNEIYMLLGDQEFTLPYDSYPQNIRYIPQFQFGLLAGFKLSPNWQSSIEVNVGTLEIKDVFSIQVYDASNTTSQEQYQLGNIYGKESRFTGRFNLDYITDNEKLNYIIGGSGVFSAWRMDEHFAEFKGYVIPLFSKFNPNNNITEKVTDVGFGLGLNLGVEYGINDKITCQFMYQPYSAKLDYGYTYNKRLLIEHDITVRILWK